MICPSVQYLKVIGILFCMNTVAKLILGVMVIVS